MKEPDRQAGCVSDQDVSEWLNGGNPVMITDEAIEKVKAVTVSGLESSSELIQNLHKKLLKISKDHNESKEVLGCFLITDGVLSDNGAFEYGSYTKTETMPGGKISNLLNAAEDYSIFAMHNHPLSDEFSVEDIVFFTNEKIQALSLVTNTGKVTILNKTKSYNSKKLAVIIENELKKFSKSKNPDREAARSIMSKLKKAGVEVIKAK